MKREIKANLIFVIVLLILVAPGAVILVRKKLNGTSEPNFMPQGLHNSIAYNQPPPYPPGLPRVEPVEASQWVGTQLVTRSNGLAIPIRNPLDQAAYMGDRLRTQLLGQQSMDGKTRLYLLIWDQSVTSHEQLRITIAPDNCLGMVMAFDNLSPPKEVRHALQHCGYVDPPDSVAWVEVNFNTKSPAITGLSVERTDKPGQIEKIAFSALAPTTQPR